MYAVQWWQDEFTARYADVASLAAASELVSALEATGWQARYWTLNHPRTHAENYVTRYGGRKGKV